MSRAYETALDIRFEVRGGLFVRQIHHWAALLFAASIMVHLARIFFTGAFRRPREANWVIGSLLLILAMFEGYFGYSLPDDLLSGTGLRAAFSVDHAGHAGRSAPGCTGRCSAATSPATIIIPRLYALHILLIPGIILALIGVHLALVWFQKHTQFPGPGRTETQRRRRARHAGVRGQVRRVLRHDRRHPRPDGRPAADQPDLAARPVQAVADLGGSASPTST